MSEKKAISYVILSSLIWSTSFPAVKLGLSYLSPITFIFFRFLLGTLFYVILFFFLEKNFNTYIFKEKSIYLLGTLTFLSYIFQYLGQQYTLASRTALIINLFVIWVPILAIIFLKEKPSRRLLFSFAFLLPGMFLLTTGKNVKEVFHSQIMLGDVIVLLASFCWAFYVIISKSLLKKYNSHEVNMVTFGITALLSLPTFLILDNGTQMIFNWKSLLLVVHLALNCTVIAYYLYVTGLKHAGAIKTTFFVSLEVLFSFIVAVIFLGEKWEPLELVGGAMMLLAVALAV
uniref:DMT family transporter n=1 Tax=candidate division WOR-3 bacterium TaxID=2052148 RepID=A0A7V4E5G1_UNCW3